jgi:hypothetical protein
VGSVSQERLNLGILMLNNQGNTIFKYSAEKLTLVKKLFSENGYKNLKSFISNLDHKINIDAKTELIKSNDFSSLSYLDYLSNYANNLILFTKPQPIDIELNESNFQILFEKFIFKFPKQQLPVLDSPKNLYLVKDRFLPSVSERVNINITLKAEDYNYLVFDTHLDMIGKNDIPVLNQFIDFELGSATLVKNVQSYLSMVKPFELKEKKLGKFFIVGDEPSKDLEKQHLAWEQLRNSNLVSKEIVELVPSAEIERIEDYLIDHNVRPFIESS